MVVLPWPLCHLLPEFCKTRLSGFRVGLSPVSKRTNRRRCKQKFLEEVVNYEGMLQIANILQMVNSVS